VRLEELGRLTQRQRAEIEAGEKDPFGSTDPPFEWRTKDRHVVLRSDDGRLVASAGIVLAEVRSEDQGLVGVVGIGGVIVTASLRGQGLGKRIIEEVLGLAARAGPGLALLFCQPDRVALYLRHGFAKISAPVLVRQRDGYVPAPAVTMWRAIRPGAELPSGKITVESLPF
jgi:predicted N-acetyltransferase YhbS